jgi:ribosomal-protein-alanine N-acetyltransferase
MAIRADELGISEVMTLVPMRRKHLRAVLHIEQQVYPEPWTTGLFLSELALRAVRDYTVALINNDVVGYAGLSYVDTDAHVTNIAVDPYFQRRSIATRLLLECFALCAKRPIENMTLEVRTSNEPAQALYRKFGFAPAGVRKDYYSSPREDALIMWANDIDSKEYEQRLLRIAAAAEEVK